MEIKYNVPIEVTEKQYLFMMDKLAGIVAGRKDQNGKFYIKVWAMKYAPVVEKILTH